MNEVGSNLSPIFIVMPIILVIIVLGNQIRKAHVKTTAAAEVISVIGHFVTSALLS